MKKVIVLACLSMLPMTYVAAEGYQVNAQSTKQAGKYAFQPCRIGIYGP